MGSVRDAFCSAAADNPVHLWYSFYVRARVDIYGYYDRAFVWSIGQLSFFLLSAFIKCLSSCLLYLIDKDCECKWSAKCLYFIFCATT